MTEFQNPNQDPGAERRLLLAFVLTILVIAATQVFIARYLPKPAPTAVPQQKGVQPPPAPPPPPSGGKQTSIKPSKAAPIAGKAAAHESQITVENDLYRITFTNRGAQVKSWVLKNYDDDKGRPLDLVNAPAAAQFGYPLSLWTHDEATRKELNEALYVPSLDATELRAPATVVFEYAHQGLVARKTFHFDHSYVVKVETSVTRNDAPVAAFPAWPAGFGDQISPGSYSNSKLDWQHADKIERLAAKKISSGDTLSGPFHWAGVTDQYFAAVFLPDVPESVAMVTLRNEIQVPEKPEASKNVSVAVLGAAVGGANGPSSERIFVGPKVMDILESIHASPNAQERAGLGDKARGPGLENIVDFGFFGVIAKWLFLWLKWTQQHWSPNWGWSIIILTVIINVALFPLRISSMKSALKMQKVAPQMKAIQEKYKRYKFNDPRKADMQKEVSALYKREGVNPVGGCFPMLLQLPFLYAFYAMLGNAMELRHAGWLWLKDLSAADPYHLLPIGIVITMFLTQKLTPQATMDKAQQRMMAVMMPVMLGIISWSLSAGLCLYWTVSNLIAILQQFWINRTAFGREMLAATAARGKRK